MKPTKVKNDITPHYSQKKGKIVVELGRYKTRARRGASLVSTDVLNRWHLLTALSSNMSSTLLIMVAPSMPAFQR